MSYPARSEGLVNMNIFALSEIHISGSISTGCSKWVWICLYLYHQKYRRFTPIWWRICVEKNTYLTNNSRWSYDCKCGPIKQLACLTCKLIRSYHIGPWGDKFYRKLQGVIKIIPYQSSWEILYSGLNRSSDMVKRPWNTRRWQNEL